MLTGLDDPRVVAGVVVAVAGEESDLTLADERQDAEPVQLRLKEPPGVGEGLGGQGSQHGRDGGWGGSTTPVWLGKQ